MLTIDKNVPIPKNVKGLDPKKHIYRDMEVGDSVLIEDGNFEYGNPGVKFYNAAKTYGSRNGKDFCARLVLDGLRVWRIA